MRHGEYEQVVKGYFKRFPDRISFDATSLTFSILLGLPPYECEGMTPEPEWSNDMYAEFDGVMATVLEYQHGNFREKTGQKKRL